MAVGMIFAHEASICFFDVLPRGTVGESERIEGVEDGQFGGGGQVGFPIEIGIDGAHFVDEFEELSLGESERSVRQIADARMSDAHVAHFFALFDDEIARGFCGGIRFDFLVDVLRNFLSFLSALHDAML